MTNTDLTTLGGEYPARELRLSNRADQKHYTRELERVTAETAVAVRAEQARIGLANLHERGRAVIANTAIDEVAALSALEEHLRATVPAAAPRVAAIVNAFTTGASMKILRW
ncbi:MAG: hypothetical protein BGO95_04095 [Micrococcales bacterium 73-13]|nr:MAG: hypothetical protein BGO95_04095 [Micrococcales bacterium 73-13]